MTSPKFATTLDDERYYTWFESPGAHFPSITTVIKQGVPSPFLQQWAVKKTAELALSDIDTLIELKEHADAS